MWGTSERGSCAQKNAADSKIDELRSQGTTNTSKLASVGVHIGEESLTLFILMVANNKALWDKNSLQKTYCYVLAQRCSGTNETSLQCELEAAELWQ